MSTHLPPQILSFAGHTQAPPAQVLPFAHAFPHLPQFNGSDLLSTHLSLQKSATPPSPIAGQAQPPFWQVEGAAQVFPQKPQFASSVLRSTHAEGLLRSPQVVR